MWLAVNTAASNGRAYGSWAPPGAYQARTGDMGGPEAFFEPPVLPGSHIGACARARAHWTRRFTNRP